MKGSFRKKRKWKINEMSAYDKGSHKFLFLVGSPLRPLAPPPHGLVVKRMATHEKQKQKN